MFLSKELENAEKISFRLAEDVFGITNEPRDTRRVNLPALAL